MSRSFAYDVAGNRTSQTDFNNATLGYAYDSLNRLTTISYPGGAQASFTYDALSRLLTATNQSGTVSFAYDALGRVTSTTDVAGIITTYAYDQNGNRERMSVGTVPNVAPSTATATYQYDALNRMTRITDAAGAAVLYAYDASGRVTSRTLPNGVVTSIELTLPYYLSSITPGGPRLPFQVEDTRRPATRSLGTGKRPRTAALTRRRAEDVFPATNVQRPSR